MVWIEEALDVTHKTTIRRRRLPSEVAVQAVIGMALYRSRSMGEVVECLDLALPSETGLFVSKSAITQARQRLGPDPLEVLHRRSAAAWIADEMSGKTWRGLSVYGMDGTSLRTPDTPQNRDAFGAQIYQSGKVSSYPQVRVVTLSSIPTRLVLDASFGHYGTNEMRYAEELIERIPDHSLTLFDKGFFGAALLTSVSGKGAERHFLIPARKNVRYERVSGFRDDAIVRMKVSPQARSQHPELGDTWDMRMVRGVDSKGDEFHLLTSLTDRARFPAKELLALYLQRWELETSYLELKGWLADDSLTLRSQSPDCIRQEIWGTLIGYNLVRMEMAKAVKPSSKSPRTVSFVHTLHVLQDMLVLSANRGKGPNSSASLMNRRLNQLGRKLHPPSKGRKCPRVVKAKPKRYAERWVRDSRGSPPKKRRI